MKLMSFVDFTAMAVFVAKVCSAGKASFLLTFVADEMLDLHFREDSISN